MMFSIRVCACGRDCWRLGTVTAHVLEFFCFYCGRAYYPEVR